MKFKELKNKKWFGIVTNMYILVLTVFVIWMLFFDTNSLLIHLELRKEINKLEKTKEYLKDEFAREKYYLKKKDEEIFLIEYQDSIEPIHNE